LIDTRLKIAVFIDFDNIEIGVKNTLGLPLDISAILEGVKERGEIVTKIAYGDWNRAGHYGRELSHQAIRMVQRNVTPGGDKNGADINLALDALEMAFTHSHINAFVIVGGDSDFITLVEKLKQYDRKVFVVGGRQFTSVVMQKNCHEFIAYENLVEGRRTTHARRQGEPATGGSVDVTKVFPLIRRALKVLSDREVAPQLGLLKSTLLQLDSTFSERDYAAGTFRDFIEKVARTGLVTLRDTGRSMLVELAEAAGPSDAATPHPTHTPVSVRETVVPPVIDSGQAQQLFQQVQEIFNRADAAPRWPMYVRQFRQQLRAADPTFDESKAGFQTILQFLRACQQEGLLRIERDRRGQLRVFPGARLTRSAGPGEADVPPAPPPPQTEEPQTEEIAAPTGEAEITAAAVAMTEASPEPSTPTARPTRARRGTRKTVRAKPRGRVRQVN
jgi:uncharacterized LabA/DUF88 family protein